MKDKLKKNKLDLEFREEKVFTMREKLEWLTEHWKIIGMKGKPTMDDINHPTTVELETILSMRKYLKDKIDNNILKK